MEILFTRGDVSIRLSEVIACIDKKRAEHHRKNGHAFEPEILEAQIGMKYIRLVTRRPGIDLSGSVYCFLDKEGNIYKAASFKAPAKGIRGSVFDPDCSWGKGLGPYGAAYLR